MSIFKRTPKTSRAYPAAALSVSGDARRFFRAKTSGARQADRQGQAWEDASRERERTGRRGRRGRG